MAEFYHIKNISEVNQLFGLGKPLHPLITVIRQWPKVDFDFSKVKLTSDLYLLSMKGTTFQYGRNEYDFEEGTLVFLAPNQVTSFVDPIEKLDDSGWSILFHPDLIRKSTLGKEISGFSFFDYDVNEALHLSDKEKQFLITLVDKIEQEIDQNLDKHSQDLIVHNLGTILKYSNRYFDRQFYTRANINKDIVSRFEQFLNTYFDSNELQNEGIPTLKKCGEALNMSGSYLSDLLCIETGKSALDHIHAYLIENAKSALLNSGGTISEVAFNVGFSYPQHFSILFKSKTGLSPSQYRSLN
ncbi:MAG: AraC-like DNA-binding protein [Crocinitomix sp.]|jgi:AraC-like DNA-binding protein